MRKLFRTFFQNNFPNPDLPILPFFGICLGTGNPSEEGLLCGQGRGDNSMEIEPIAHIHTGFPAKFGIPRQSGLVEGLHAVIEMEPAFRDAAAFRSIEGFSHLWLLWGFSENSRAGWSPTVRPPRLGGNRRVGVFASRSSFRPNGLGLSVVRLEKFVPQSPHGPLLHVSGADLMDGTPIYDIKPYLPFTDSHPEAEAGFAAEVLDKKLEVVIPENCMEQIPLSQRSVIRQLLAQDPRPSYQDDPDRLYGFVYENWEIRFRVDSGHLLVVEVRHMNGKSRLKNNI